jgi:hypothetical protein
MSEELLVQGNTLPSAPPDVIEKIKSLEARVRPHEHTLQVQMEHVLHAGMYSRTCRLAAGMLITSVLIKIPTMLVVNGRCCVFAGDKWYSLEGYQVMPASAGRKQVYVTIGPTEITMIFPSNAKTVEEAEAQFTDEMDQLLTSRRDGNDLITVTGV